MLGVLIEQLVIRLGGANLVIVDLLNLILGRGLLTLLGGVIGAIIEAVTLPRGSGELGPHDMVVSQFARREVNDINLLPVAAGARDGVGEILLVV